MGSPPLAAGTTIELKQDFKPLLQNETADLWVPLPMELKGYQSVSSLTHTGNADKVKIENVGSVRMLHAQWSKTAAPEFHLVSVVKIRDHRETTKENVNTSQFLAPTAHVQTDGIVYTTAMQIVGQLTDPDQKAEAIYNWVVEKTLRDPKTRGCGLGDVKTTLTVDNLSGKCADINSVFVGLARAANIPAREVFGIRVAPSNEFNSLGKLGEVSKAQHCRAEYYSKNKRAWVPVDPADVRKAILEEKLSLDDPKIAKLRHKFFGYWEGNWVALNFGRDFLIPSKPEPIKINYFMYPKLVSKSLAPDGMDPKEVAYTITSTILTK